MFYVFYILFRTIVLRKQAQEWKSNNYAICNQCINSYPETPITNTRHPDFVLNSTDTSIKVTLTYEFYTGPEHYAEIVIDFLTIHTFWIFSGEARDWLVNYCFIQV